MFRACQMQSAAHARTTVDLDKDLALQLKQVVSLTKQNPATVLRQAIRAGLPVVARFQSLRPEGYFADAYPRPKDRQELEAAMARIKQHPNR
jgi:hypothetical protein